MQQLMDQAPTDTVSASARLSQLEHHIGERATPTGETTIVRAFGPKGEVFYAVQLLRYWTPSIDYAAVRLRKLGHIRYIGNRDRPMFVSAVVLSESYHARDNSLYAIVNMAKQRVSLGPRGQMALKDPEDSGMGLGSYAMSRLIGWLRAHYPDFPVARSPLPEHLEDPDEQSRCEGFLTRHGFTLKRETGAGGYFYAESVRQLRERVNAHKIEEIGIDGLFTTFAAMQEWHQDLRNEFEQLQAEREQLQQVIPRLRRRAWGAGFAGLLAGILFGAGSAHWLL